MLRAKIEVNLHPIHLAGSTFKVNGKDLLVKDYQLRRGSDGRPELVMTIGHAGFDLTVYGREPMQGEQCAEQGTGNE